MKRRRLIVLALAVVALAAAGWWWWANRAARTQTDTLVLYGNADIRQVQLAFNNSDRIKEVLVEEGDRVKAGQVVARLETTRLEPALRQAQARLDAQQQAVNRLVAGSRPQEIKRAQALADEAEARLKDAQSYAQEIKEARAQNAAGVREAERAAAELDAARAAHQAALETLELLRAGPRTEDIAQAKAVLDQLRAERDLAQQRLTDAELHAPKAGVIRDRLLEPGDMASPTRPALTIALTDPIWIRAYVDEVDLGLIASGMPATITTDSFPDRSFEGWVGYISPTAEFTPKTVESPRVRTSLVYEVRIFVHNPDSSLRLGMPATVTLDTAEPDPSPAP